MKKENDTWLAVKKNDMERDWSPRPSYKEVSRAPDNAKDYIPTEKMDGAHFIAKINPNGISFTSQRKSVAGNLIAREDNVPHLRDLKLPTKYHGMTIRGELWHDKGFNTLSGILNSKPHNAVEAQNKKGLVRFAPFRIDKGPGGKQITYEEQHKLLKEISKDLPWFFEPPKSSDKDPMEFFSEVGAKKGEGIILSHKETGENLKFKHRFDYDLKIDGFTDGTGKYSGRAIGAIKLVDKTGRRVGNVGTGIDDATRIDMYKNPSKYIGKLVKVESRKPLKGSLREPSLLGFSIDKYEADEVK
jgi:ATP-dependent DNA ligase